ncbi:MAG: hypothetical protein K2M44_04595 [Clostridia bacterium]|nr:hypothetical protein [Clostridia bacterium]
MKFKIHPLFVAASLATVLWGDVLLLVSYVVAIVIHEVAHARMAALRGYTLGTVTLMPYGGVISGGERYSRSDNILIALAGPAINVIVGVMAVALWWLMPESYAYTKSLCIANLSLAVVNLMPLYPLDGSRVVLALARNKLRALTGLKIAGVIASVLLVLLSILSVLFTFNLSIGIMGVFLFYGALWGTDDEAYIHVASMSPMTKDYKAGVEKRNICVSSDMPLFKILPLIRRDSVTTFFIIDADGKEIYTFCERELEQMCVDNDLSVAVFDAYKGGPSNKSLGRR